MGAARRCGLLFGALCALGPVAAAPLPGDPLASLQWPALSARFYPGETARHDPRIRVEAPSPVEDPLQLPVRVDASALGEVAEIALFVDYNPIPRVARFTPLAAAARLQLRVKIQQSSPIRAVVRTGDGRLLMNGRWVEAAGGGCTVPSLASARSDWSERLGEVYGRLWRGDQSARLRLRIMHPMDTGLVDTIPAYYVERLALERPDGAPLARLETWEPVAENPLFSFDLPAALVADGVRLRARDNAGTRIGAVVTP